MLRPFLYHQEQAAVFPLKIRQVATMRIKNQLRPDEADLNFPINRNRDFGPPLARTHIDPPIRRVWFSSSTRAAIASFPCFVPTSVLSQKEILVSLT